MIKDYKFHGYDFAELFECFEIPYGDEIPHMNYEIVERKDVKEEDVEEDQLESITWESMNERLDKENPNWKQEAEEEEKKEQESIKNLQSFINHHASNMWLEEKDIPEESKLVYEKCIEFLDALIVDSKKWTYLTPIWKGLRKIKDKGTLLQMYSNLVTSMWT